MDNSTSTTSISSDYMWTAPQFIKMIDTGNSIEAIYKQQSLITNGLIFNTYNSERVFKIVYSCIDGKWNKSEPIYGEIIPASEEEYLFEQD